MTDLECVPAINARIGNRIEIYGRAWTIQSVRAQPNGHLLFTLLDPERHQVIQTKHAPSEHVLRKKEAND